VTEVDIGVTEVDIEVTLVATEVTKANAAKGVTLIGAIGNGAIGRELSGTRKKPEKENVIETEIEIENEIIAEIQVKANGGKGEKTTEERIPKGEKHRVEKSWTEETEIEPEKERENEIGTERKRKIVKEREREQTHQGMERRRR